MFPAVRQRGASACEHALDDAIAALAGEAEDLERGGIEVARQRLAEQRPGAEQPGAHRRGGDAEALCRLLDGHLFDLAHDEHRAKRHRQLVDPALDHRPDLGAQRRTPAATRSFVGHSAS